MTNPDLTYNNIQTDSNDQILNKVMSAPVIYVRQDPQCGLCPDTYKVYIHSTVISDGNFDILKDPLFHAVDEACCLCEESCSVLNFYSPFDKRIIYYNVAPPKCCEGFCGNCCKGFCGKCCKSESCCSCVKYGKPLFASYGPTSNLRFGFYMRRYGCCWKLSPNEWEIFGKGGDSRYTVQVECCASFNPCIQFCPLKLYIKKGGSEIGTIIRSPRGCCNCYTYEIQFPSGFTLEDRLLLIAFCCKRA